MRPFRFGYQVGGAEDVRQAARDAERAGFDVVHTWDHVSDGWSPLAPLLAMAEATETIRVCPLVLNNDFHHPVHLARELAAIDRLSGGRLEVGLGAGHSFPEYRAIGAPFDPPAARKARLAESVEILRQLLDGETVHFEGEHYRLDDVRVQRPVQPRVPILVGVNGRRALAHAARHADIVGLTMLGRTLEDGQRHEVRWQSARLDETIAGIRAASSGRSVEPELHALVQRIVVSPDRRAAAEELAGPITGLSVDDALETPFLGLGSHDQIAEHLLRCRRRWGISYYSVRDIRSFAPVIERIRTLDQTEVRGR